MENENNTEEPSFQEFFGLSDEEKEAFEKACELAVEGEKIKKI